MHFSKVIAISLLAPLAAAYGTDTPSQLRARDPFAAIRSRGLNERCGPSHGNQVCEKNECCSSSGYCGTTKDHCKAPDCQFRYGPACDANTTPSGKTTRDIRRPQLGKIPYGGAGVYACTKPGMVAITYDDGPYVYTEDIMKQFEAKGGRATFFVTGNSLGKGAIDKQWTSVVKKMYDKGHQVASHSWSHPDLSKSTKAEIYDQMVKNEMAIRNILGRFPTYMRPPYSSCGSECQRVMSDLGYVIAYFDVDTDGTFLPLCSNTKHHNSNDSILRVQHLTAL